ncbi:hypothetical protein GL218_00704 [Daldinia childiae]|uniref:uncharacterized protein n=1 Tax=Daldinia childiae TaxID=326645 RepID=UPI001446E743|nr:uncharacterized protein GL218_00704 [Daldinia childiae]KAF3070561.1 hypothetical protein GL218_00704 [Daldinia childiae]
MSTSTFSKSLAPPRSTNCLLSARQLRRATTASHQHIPIGADAHKAGDKDLRLPRNTLPAFDGIVASAPAVDLAGLGVGDHWPQVVMKAMGQYPKNCELAAITEAFIKHCDGDDGLLDGIVTDPDSCDFDPHSVVNKSIDCQDTDSGTVKISEAAINVAIATWTGAQKSDGSFLWWGVKKGSSLVDGDTKLGVSPGLATTTCSGNGTCTGHTMEIVDAWIRLLIKKDPTFDVTTVTIEEFQDLFQQSLDEYGSIINVKPNLDAFRDRWEATIIPRSSRCYPPHGLFVKLL